LATGGQDAEGDRQVETAGFLGQVGRGQIDGDSGTQPSILKMDFVNDMKNQWDNHILIVHQIPMTDGHHEVILSIYFRP